MILFKKEEEVTIILLCHPIYMNFSINLTLASNLYDTCERYTSKRNIHL